MNVFDLVVRILGNGQGLRDDIAEDEAAVESLQGAIESLDGKDVTIDVDDADAKAKVDELKAKLDDMHHKTLRIFLSDQSAEDKLYAFAAKLEALREQTMHLDVDDRDAKDKLDVIKLDADELKAKLEDMLVGMEDTEAIGKIDDLMIKLDEVRAMADDIKVKIDDTEAKPVLDELLYREEALRHLLIEVDDADAEAKVKQLQLELDKIKSTALKIDLRDADALIQLDELDIKLDGVQRRIDEINATPVKPPVGGATAGARMTRGAVLAGLLPMAAPLGAVALGGLGGLGAAFGAGAAGVGAYAAAAGPTLKSVLSAASALNQAQAQLASATTASQRTSALQAMAKATAGLDQEQRSALQSLQQFEATYQSFASSLSKPVLSSFNAGLQVLKTLLTDIRPLAAAMANEITQLLNGLNKDLAGAGAKQFFSWLAQEGPKMFADFAKGLENVGAGLAHLMMDFTPLANQMGAGWVKMTKDFDQWASALGKSKGFKQFVQYVLQETPVVKSLFDGLVSIIGELLKILAPIGTQMLQLAANLAQFIATALRGNSVLRDLISVVVTVVANVIKFIAQIVQLVTWLTKTHPIIMDIVTAVAAVATAFLLPISPIVAVIAAIAGLITAGEEVVKHWTAIKTWFVQLWDSLKAFFSKWGTDILLVLSPFLGVPLEIWQHWDKITGWFRSTWSTLRTDAVNALTAIGNWIRNFWDNLASEALQWGWNISNHIAQGIRNAIGAVRSAVSSVASAIGNFLGFHSPTEEGPGSEADKWMPNLMSMLTDGIKAGTPAVQAALSQVFVAPNVASMVRAAGQQYGATAVAAIHAGGNTFAVHVNGPVYGVDDLHAAIASGFDQHMTAFAAKLQHAARAMGVS
ncbi:MAG: hypothetical protein K6T78_12245 [Alicyclobacillus sp.]|nr:hypothetical protein [Alicyclobacillus sp.]